MEEFIKSWRNQGETGSEKPLSEHILREKAALDRVETKTYGLLHSAILSYCSSSLHFHSNLEAINCSGGGGTEHVSVLKGSAVLSAVSGCFPAKCISCCNGRTCSIYRFALILCSSRLFQGVVIVEQLFGGFVYLSLTALRESAA